MRPAHKFEDYLAETELSSTDSILLKFFTDKNLFFGQWLITKLPAAKKITQADITITHILDFIGDESKEDSKNIYTLMILMMFKMPIINEKGIKVDTPNPYHVDTADLVNIVMSKINEKRKEDGLLALNTLKPLDFINYIQDSAGAGALNSAELAEVTSDILDTLGDSGSESAKRALDFVTQGMQPPEAKGILGNLGDLFTQGQKLAEAELKKTLRDDRPLEGSELVKCGTAQRQLLEDNLNLLAKHDIDYASKFNQIIRKYIESGVDVDAKIKISLGRLAVCLRKVSSRSIMTQEDAKVLFAAANNILYVVHRKQFRQQVLPQKDPVKVLGFLTDIRPVLQAKLRKIFGPRAEVPAEINDYMDANKIDQTRVVNLLANIDTHPGLAANEQQRRLARRLSKLLADIEDYKIATEIDTAAPDDVSRYLKLELFKKFTNDYDKLKSRVRRNAMEEGVQKTFYPAPGI